MHRYNTRKPPLNVKKQIGKCKISRLLIWYLFFKFAIGKSRAKYSYLSITMANEMQIGRYVRDVRSV